MFGERFEVYTILGMKVQVTEIKKTLHLFNLPYEVAWVEPHTRYQFVCPISTNVMLG